MAYVKGLVSVIIPTYKRADTVTRAVESVLAQTYGSIECVVVNDNEKNDEFSIGLYEKLKPFIERGKIVVLEQECHKNGAAARNFGIHHARGEYIAFLDDDDWWVTDKIAKQIACIEQQDGQCGGVSTLATYYKGNRIVRKTSPYESGKIYKEIMAREFDVITCSLLLKHEALDNTGYFDENLRRHQEIQLLAFFTEQYSLVLVPEYLTCISVDDAKNRLNADVLKKVKDDFFQSVDPVMNHMSIDDQRYVKYMHKIELIYIYAKERRFWPALRESILLIQCPKALLRSMRRVWIRMKEAEI